MNKLYRNVIPFFLIMLMMVSCQKDKYDSGEVIYNKWEVIDMMSVESVHYAKNNNYNPLIQFFVNGSVSINLDANNCIGNFALTGEDKIEIMLTGCTEICCDSDFSVKIQEMLSQVKNYSIEQNKLKLNVPGWGWINLELHH